MNRSQVASLIIPVISIVCLLSGGFLLQAKGHDQVTASQTSKSSTLSSDSIHVSFEEVGGKVVNIPFTEEKIVKKGDILMTLDSTDVDLQIEKLQKQMKQYDTQIMQQQKSIQLGYSKASTQEKQAQLAIEQSKVSQSKSQSALESAQAAQRQAQSAHRQVQAAEKEVNNGARAEDIKQQQIAIQSATQSLQTAQINYDRTQKLYNSGLSTKADMDNAEQSLTLAKNQLNQQQEALTKLNNGATLEEREQANERTQQAVEQSNQANVSVTQAQTELHGAELAIQTSQTQLDAVQQARQQLADQELAVDLLQQQKDAQQIELKTLLLKKSRLILKAPSNGKITAISTEVGENISQGAPIVTLETNKMYFDLYVSEDQATKFHAKQKIKVNIPALHKDLNGEVRYITAAPQFANLKMAREKGEADVATFQVRIYVDKSASLLPGMTTEVNIDEITS
ncbi:HlyD family secretion protein [Paenibacillus nicotianae]|uniref:HlyD family secretion protein n=1 Tax=Paenibacillus nicotianae TaxID=1526551 RepID=A0ABW4URR9_9BACL